METLIAGHLWLLPAVTVVGWLVSWWAPWPRWIRWSVLFASFLASVICIAGTLHARPAALEGCRPSLDCTDWGGVYLAAAGLVELLCFAVLLIATLAAELITLFARRDPV